MEIRHHAYLYAVLCRHILECAGRQEGEKLIEAFTRDYGLRRGRRMKKNAESGDMSDFFIVGEWKGQPGENISCLSYEKDETVSVVTKCAWYDTWKEYGLLDYGPYYCRYIDKAICEGYASDFSLDVSETIGGGNARCVFKWSAPADKDLVTGTKKAHILPFDFHCKEMLESVKNVLDKELCETVLKKTQRDFEEEFGDSDLF